MLAKIDPRRVHRQLRGYLRSLGWVLRDACRMFAAQASMVAALNFVGVAAGAASLGGIVALAKHAGQPEPWRFAGLQIDLSGGVGNLLVFAMILAIIGLAGGCCIYVSERVILSLTRQYEAANSRRILDLLEQPRFRGWTDLLERPTSRSITRLLSAGSRYTAYAWRDMMRGLLPIITLTFSVAALLWIDALITVLLAPVVLAYLGPLYLVNLRVARIQREYRQLAPTVRRRLLQRVRLYAGHADDLVGEESPNLFASDEYRLFSRLHYRRMLAAKQVHFLNTVFAMLCLLALMTYFAIANQLYGRDWSDLLAYIIALRFTVSALRSVSTVFVLFSRFLPEYSSYAMAVEGADRIAKRREHIGQSSISLPRALTLKLGSHARLPSQKRLSIDTSKALFVLVPWRTVRTELDAIASRLEHRLVESVDFARRAIVKASANGRMEDQVRESGVATIIPMELWRARLAPSDSFFVVVGHRADAAMGNEQIGSVVVMDDRRIIGGGDCDWLRQNLEPIKAALATAAAVRETADDDEEDLEDDFE